MRNWIRIGPQRRQMQCWLNQCLTCENRIEKEQRSVGLLLAAILTSSEIASKSCPWASTFLICKVGRSLIETSEMPSSPEARWAPLLSDVDHMSLVQHALCLGRQQRLLAFKSWLWSRTENITNFSPKGCLVGKGHKYGLNGVPSKKICWSSNPHSEEFHLIWKQDLCRF